MCVSSTASIEAHVCSYVLKYVRKLFKCTCVRTSLNRHYGGTDAGTSRCISVGFREHYAYFTRISTSTKQTLMQARRALSP